jgi:hypothetical protein
MLDAHVQMSSSALCTLYAFVQHSRSIWLECSGA